VSFALPDPRKRPWLTVAELAEISGEGEKVIRAALAAGQLPELRLGRYVRIPTHLLMLQLGMDTPNMSADPAPTGPNTATEPVEGAFTHDLTKPLRSA
jgi:hypothetical protein